MIDAVIREGRGGEEGRASEQLQTALFTNCQLAWPELEGGEGHGSEPLHTSWPELEWGSWAGPTR